MDQQKWCNYIIYNIASASGYADYEIHRRLEPHNFNLSIIARQNFCAKHTLQLHTGTDHDTESA